MTWSINKPGIDVPVLELAAEEIRRWPTLTEEVKKDLIMAEEKTVYSQVFVFLFCVPLRMAIFSSTSVATVECRIGKVIVLLTLKYQILRFLKFTIYS